MKFLFFITLLTSSLLNFCYAGALSDFEKDATKNRGGGSSTSNNEKECSFLAIIFLNCDEYKTSRRSGSGSNSSNSKSYLSNFHSMSYFRTDAFFQTANTDISSTNLALEYIEDSFGFHIKVTKFSETSPPDELYYSQLHGLLRLENNQKFNFGLGLGFGILKGESKTTGVSLFIPIQYKLSQHFGLEMYSSITTLNGNPIIDNRVSVSASFEKMSLLLSYLSLNAPNESIYGPSLGISLTF